MYWIWLIRRCAGGDASQDEAEPGRRGRGTVLGSTGGQGQGQGQDCQVGLRGAIVQWLGGRDDRHEVPGLGWLGAWWVGVESLRLPTYRRPRGQEAAQRQADRGVASFGRQAIRCGGGRDRQDVVGAVLSGREGGRGCAGWRQGELLLCCPLRWNEDAQGRASDGQSASKVSRFWSDRVSQRGGRRTAQAWASRREGEREGERKREASVCCLDAAGVCRRAMSGCLVGGLECVTLQGDWRGRQTPDRQTRLGCIEPSSDWMICSREGLSQRQMTSGSASLPATAQKERREERRGANGWIAPTRRWESGGNGCWESSRPVAGSQPCRDAGAREAKNKKEE